jgi:hypothetical protein
MLAQVLAPYINVPPQTVERLLSLTPAEIYADESYQGMVAQLNANSLQKTSDYAYAVYDEQLPALKAQYGLLDTLMGGYTLCNWVLGFLMYPETLPDMVGRHTRIPTDVVAEVLPKLVTMLDTMPQGRAEWQRALVVLSLPLLAR